MPSAPDIHQFLARLRAAGFTVSTADVLRLTDLLARLAAERRDDERGLKSVLGPLIARSADEQARFGHLYDEFFQPRANVEADVVPLPRLPTEATTAGTIATVERGVRKPWWK